MMTRTLSIVALALTAAVTSIRAQSQHVHSMTPAVSAAAMKQIQEVQRSATPLSTPEAAKAAGFEPVLGWIPMMGTHWVHGPRMLTGKTAVTITEPSQLMFSKVNGKETLVGIAYAYYAEIKDKETPALFDGAPAWHDHPDLAPPGTNLLMLHTWFVESPDGPFAGMNPFLPYWAADVTPPVSDQLRDADFSKAVRKGALALAEIVDTAGIFPILARRPAVKPVLDSHRAEIRLLVPKLNAAKPGSQGEWRTLVDALGTHFDAMREAYVTSALDPNVKARITKALDDMIGGGHSH